MRTNFDFLKIEYSESLLQNWQTLQPFNQLIVSFCADTPPGTSVEVQARVRLTDGAVTRWFSWGIWSPFINRHSIEDSDSYASMDTDTLTLKEGRFAEAVQLRVLPTSNSSNELPLVRRIVLASKNTQIPCQEPTSACEDVYVSTPCYSQMVRDPRIGPVICSATTIAMLLNQKGENVLPEEVALHNYDSVYKGCGNWCFSTAIAASYGYDAYVRFATLDDLVEEIKRGNAVGASVRYTNDPANEKYPYIEEAPCTTAGHLLVVCGFHTTSNGRQYAIVHDPAAPDQASVERFYPLERFLEAWCNRLIYVVHREVQLQKPRYIPQHLAGCLGVPRDGEYPLVVDNQEILLQPDGDFRNTVVACAAHANGEKEAECDFAYGEVSASGMLKLPDDRGEKLYVITNRGRVYEVHESRSR